MPTWLIQLGKLFVSLLADKLVGIISDYLKEKYEQHKTSNEIKLAVKKLRQAKTEEEIRSALRNLSL